MNKIALIKQLISELNDTEKTQLFYSLKNKTKSTKKQRFGSASQLLLKTKFKNGLFCPICSCANNIGKYGKTKNGIQRYICRDCHKTFTLTTNTVFYGAKKTINDYKKYIHLMMEGASIRRASDECGISIRTSFLWRHKFLNTLNEIMNGVKLEGVVEMDETFFNISYKGSRHLPREPHKRGERAKHRGISSDKVCVPCGVNRDGKSVAKIANLGRISTIDVFNVFQGKVDENSVLCTDENSSYIKFSNDAGLNIIQIKADTHNSIGLFNIQHINNYHSRLKRFLRPFNGVATKYLNNYLLWNNFMVYGNGSEQDLLVNLATVVSMDRNSTIQTRDAIPLLRAA